MAMSFARLAINLPSEAQRMVVTEDTISARYMSIELLQDDALPTPESDMWAFGGIAFWVRAVHRPVAYLTETEFVFQDLLRTYSVPRKSRRGSGSSTDYTGTSS
jgi:hypothetical protein